MNQNLLKVVLFFYPLDFTFVCPTEIIEFSNKLEPFIKSIVYLYNKPIELRNSEKSIARLSVVPLIPNTHTWSNHKFIIIHE